MQTTFQPVTLRALRTAGTLGLVLACAACSQFGSFHVPFMRDKTPDLTPARASAENIIRLDAATRSGCEQVDNIEKPTPNGGAQSDPRDQATQRWVARTCHGDISYDVVTTPGPHGPTVSVHAVPGPLDRPMNPNFKPAIPGAASE